MIQASCGPRDKIRSQLLLLLLLLQLLQLQLLLQLLLQVLLQSHVASASWSGARFLFSCSFTSTLFLFSFFLFSFHSSLPIGITLKEKPKIAFLGNFDSIDLLIFSFRSLNCYLIYYKPVVWGSSRDFSFFLLFLFTRNPRIPGYHPRGDLAEIITDVIMFNTLPGELPSFCGMPWIDLQAPRAI